MSFRAPATDLLAGLLGASPRLRVPGGFPTEPQQGGSARSPPVPQQPDVHLPLAGGGGHVVGSQQVCEERVAEGPWERKTEEEGSMSSAGPGPPRRLRETIGCGTPQDSCFWVLSHCRESETWPPSAERRPNALQGSRCLETGRLGKGQFPRGHGHCGHGGSQSAGQKGRV